MFLYFNQWQHRLFLVVTVLVVAIMVCRLLTGILLHVYTYTTQPRWDIHNGTCSSLTYNNNNNLPLSDFTLTSVVSHLIDLIVYLLYLRTCIQMKHNQLNYVLYHPKSVRFVNFTLLLDRAITKIACKMQYETARTI